MSDTDKYVLSMAHDRVIELEAQVKHLQEYVRSLTMSYDSAIDVVREFFETDYCSRDGEEWLRYYIGIDDEESE